MKNKTNTPYQMMRITIIVIFLSFADTLCAQQPTEVSLVLYPGFTLVNFEEALDYPDDDMTDWSQVYFSVAAKAFLKSEKKIQFGAELAWQQLYYASYRIPYGPSPVYREFNVTSISTMALGRYMINNFFVTGGAGLHFFNSGVSPSISAEAGYAIKAGEHLKFPLSVRINPIFASGTPTALSVGIGATYCFR